MLNKNVGFFHLHNGNSKCFTQELYSVSGKNKNKSFRNIKMNKSLFKII